VRAIQFCQQILSKSLGRIHAVRLAALWFAVDCLMRGRQLSLTALGRAGRGRFKEKHSIKKLDRLMGNRHVIRERDLIWKAIAQQLLRNASQPVIVIDWTPWREGFHSLTAGLAVGGRCLLFYGEVHAEKKLNNRKVHRQFLDRLGEMLPPRCAPILVTDAGFRTTWFDEVEHRGWDFVGRIRGRVRWYDSTTNRWLLIKELYARADRRPRHLGMLTITQSAPRQRHAVLVLRKGRLRRKKRVMHKTPGMTKRRGHIHHVSAADKYYRNVAQEPWLLVTTLKEAPAAEVMRLYSLRMQTEESYRGLKSHRYGWSFEDSLSRTAERLSVLLLIGALACLAACLVGWIVEQRGRHRDYQANTERSRRVLSWFFLGIRVCLRRDQPISHRDMRLALSRLCANGNATIST
jgi:hypothetical protein